MLWIVWHSMGTLVLAAFPPRAVNLVAAAESVAGVAVLEVALVATEGVVAGVAATAAAAAAAAVDPS